MNGELHAFLLCGLVLATIVLRLCRGRQSKDRPFKWAALVVFLTICGVGFFSSVHLCEAGTPLTQWLVPALCAGYYIWTVKIPSGSVILVFVVGLLYAVGLSSSYVSLVHMDQYTGNPKWELYKHRITGEPPSKVEAEWHTVISGLYAVH